MNGYAGRSPLESRKPEGSTLKGCVQSLKREYAGLVVGMAVFTGLISPSALQCNMCSIGKLGPNSLFAAETCTTGSSTSLWCEMPAPRLSCVQLRAQHAHFAPQTS